MFTIKCIRIKFQKNTLSINNIGQQPYVRAFIDTKIPDELFSRHFLINTFSLSMKYTNKCKFILLNLI